MRDNRFRAEHRGGPLSIHHHHLLAAWAADCACRVLSIFEDDNPNDTRPRKAISIARLWADGDITVGDARDASISAHGAAREAGKRPAQFAARSAGHAAATAHMADHALRSAMYAVKAIMELNASKNTEALAIQEVSWQTDNLPVEIRDLVLSNIDNL